MALPKVCSLVDAKPAEWSTFVGGRAVYEVLFILECSCISSHKSHHFSNLPPRDYLRLTMAAVLQFSEETKVRRNKYAW